MYINTKTKQYPISEQDIRNVNPNTSFPAVFQAPDEYAIVFAVPKPEYNRVTEVVIETAPELTKKGTWQQTWEVRTAFRDYTDEEGVLHTAQEQLDAAIARDAAEKAERLQENVTTSTQQRLDDFAKTRNYDGILSACTYATSTVLKFKTEGQYCVEARDATWAKLYEILAEVQSGQRPVPNGYADIKGELPALEWPTI
jgi:hypothetical protein